MNKRLKSWAFLASLTWALASCFTQPTKIDPTSTVQNLLTSLSRTPSLAPPSIPSNLGSKIGAADDGPSKRGLLPTITPIPVPTVKSPPGLQYSTDSGQWLVTQNGTNIRIVDERCAIVSPNRIAAVMSHCGSNASSFLRDLHTGVTITLPAADEYVWTLDSRQLLFTTRDDKQSDIWARDLATGAVRNLSHTADRNEGSPQIWAARPNTMIFQSWPADKMLDGEAGGALTLMKTDGTGYEVVHPNNLYGDGIPSPDGQYIAFVLYQKAPIWLYNSATGASPFPFDKFGLTNVSNVSIPVWSPDGKQIALWGTFKQKTKEDTTGLGIFNLAHSQVTVLDHIVPIPTTGPYNDPKWSPSGNWLTVFTTEQETKQRGIWLVNTKDGDMQLLMTVDNDFCSQAWAPDERWIALNCSRAEVKPGVWIIDPRTLKQSLADLPLNAEITGWTKP